MAAMRLLWKLAVICGVLFGVLAVSNTLTRNDAPKSGRSSGASLSAFEACVDRGVNYFIEVGSFPYLSSGKAAKDVALERCARSTSAF